GNEIGVVDHDVGGLQERIAEEAIGAEVAVLEILNLLFVGRDALEPRERRDHRKQQMQFGVLEDARLDEQRRLRRIETDREPVGRYLQRVFGDGGRVFVMRRQRVPIGDEEKTFVLFLEFEPILKGAEIMAEMETA